MKRLVAVLLALTMIGTSQANMNHIGKETSGKTTLFEIPRPTAIKKEPALVRSPRIPKPKLFRSNPYRVAYYNFNIDDNDDLLIQDEDIYIGYRRQDLEKIKTKSIEDDLDDIITEEIRWKLFLARTAAMIRYRQLHG